VEVFFPRRPGDTTLNTHGICRIVLIGWVALGAASAQERSAPVPHFDARRQQTEYVGPAREPIDREDLQEILIGYFGPSDLDDPVSGPLWRAAQEAIRDANEQGGYHGTPFRLLPVWSADPWGTGIKQLTRLVYRDQVWAIVGGPDGPSTHLAEQVVAKARLPLVSPVSTDKTVNLANVPWMFSLAPGDHLIVKTLAPSIVTAAAEGPVVVISANDHDSYLFWRELNQQLRQAHVVPAFHFQFKPATGPLGRIVRECLAADPAAVVAIADASDSRRLVQAVRQAGFDRVIFGGPNMGRGAFIESTRSANPGDIVFPLLHHVGTCRKDAVDARDAKRAGRADFASLHAYDAVTLVVTAIRQAGLSRAAIRRALRDQSPCEGRSGRIEWDGLGGNTRAVTLGTIRRGSLALWRH